jgi:hypothetical protein
MGLVAVILDPAVATRIVQHLGLGTRAARHSAVARRPGPASC